MNEPLLAEFRREELAPTSQALSRDVLPSGQSDPFNHLASEDEPSTCWSWCILSSCCEPRRKRKVAAVPYESKHGSATREHRGIKPPVQGSPPTLPALVNIDAAEGSALAELAGGVCLSQILARLWPSLSKAIQGEFVETFPDLVEANKPSWLQGVNLDRFTLGDKVPVITGIHVDAIDDSDKEAVRVCMDVVWHSSSDIQLTVLALPTVLNRYLPNMFKGVVQYMTSLTAGIQAIKMEAQVLVTLSPVTTRLPVVQAMQISMLRTPDVDFSITITRGEVTFLNVLKPFLRHLVAASFMKFVLPEHNHVPVQSNTPDVQIPEGLLLVRILRAENVPKMDFWGHSDTYVDLWVRGRIKQRTSTIMRQANPEWPASEASFQFLVHTRRYQKLSLELWDDDQDLYDDLIGGASVSLADLEPVVEHHLPLQVVNARSGAAGEDAPPGLDPAHAGGRSTVNVQNTRLHVSLRYIPASMAHLFMSEIGCPGVFSMNLKKLTVPDLAVLPLKVRPHIIGQKPCATPPLSSAIQPLKGRDPKTGEDQSGRKDIPVGFDAVWDVVGSASEVCSRVLALELVSKANTASEAVLARVQVPLIAVMRDKIHGIPGGAGGGDYNREDQGFIFELTLLWSPLSDQTALHPDVTSAASDGASEAASTNGGIEGIGLQQLLIDTRDVEGDTQLETADATVVLTTAKADGLPANQSMPVVAGDAGVTQ